MIDINDVVKSAILGTVVGDALGVPVEFTSRAERDREPVTGMIAYGTHSQPKGTWSDDSSMMLATMDSLILRKRFDPSDVMRRFANWRSEGDYTPYGKCFDIGITCSKAISSYLNGTEPLKCGGDREDDNGNGSLMRIMPGSLNRAVMGNYWDEDVIEDTVSFIHDLSSLTHAHPRSLIGCMIYTSICHELIYCEEKSLETLIQDAISKIMEFYQNAWEKNDWFEEAFLAEMKRDAYARLSDINHFKTIDRNKIRSGGYIVHTLEAAIWCLLNTGSYSECVLAAVNLGDDTDTVGAVAGGLAGLYYGYNDIPDEWLKVIAEKEWIDALCNDYSKTIPLT